MLLPFHCEKVFWYEIRTSQLSIHFLFVTLLDAPEQPNASAFNGRWFLLFCLFPRPNLLVALEFDLKVFFIFRLVRCLADWRARLVRRWCNRGKLGTFFWCYTVQMLQKIISKISKNILTTWYCPMRRIFFSSALPANDSGSINLVRIVKMRSINWAARRWLHNACIWLFSSVTSWRCFVSLLYFN